VHVAQHIKGPVPEHQVCELRCFVATHRRFALQSGERQGQEFVVSAHALQHHLSDNGVVKAVSGGGSGGVIDIVLYPFDHLVILQVVLASIVSVKNEMVTAFICNKTGYIVNEAGNNNSGNQKAGDARDVVRKLYRKHYVNYNTSDILISEDGLFCLDTASIGFCSGNTAFQIRPDITGRAEHEWLHLSDTFVYSQRVADMFTNRMLSRDTERMITSYHMLHQSGLLGGELHGRVFDKRELERLMK
jgi:hypothetical protein